jgi:MYXO-CTERM domain-containing protein
MDVVEMTPMGTGGQVVTRFNPGGSGGTLGGTGTGGGSGASSGGVDAGPGQLTGSSGNGIKRCGCDVGGSSAGVLSALSLLVAAGIASRRRQRS